MEPISIALAQINICFGDPAENLQTAIPLLQSASKKGSTFILFPELWTTGYDLEHGMKHAQANLEILKELRNAAKEFHITIGGSFLLEKKNKLFNTFVLLQPGGSEVHYSKIHLFRLMDEHKFLHPGEGLQTCLFGWGKAGLSICYDLRFPEMFRVYAVDSVKIIFLVAEWPLQRISHWQHLLRARAIENQYFVAAVNATGVSGKERFGGYTALINPWGDTLGEAPHQEEELIQARIDLQMVDQIRETIPVFKDRRLDLY